MNPFPLSDIDFISLEQNEEPIDERNYYNALESFLGGDSFIRILQPLWTQNVEEFNCCNCKMIFISCIGYEGHSVKNTGFLKSEPFFVGELAFYFFLCKKCLTVKMTTQST